MWNLCVMAVCTAILISMRQKCSTLICRFKSRANVYLAGQITGVEGYVESAACGFMAGFAAWGRKGAMTGQAPLTSALARC